MGRIDTGPVLCWLSSEQVAALVALGVLPWPERVCNCGRRFAPHDGRQEFCTVSCASRVRHARLKRRMEIRASLDKAGNTPESTGASPDLTHGSALEALHMDQAVGNSTAGTATCNVNTVSNDNHAALKAVV